MPACHFKLLYLSGIRHGGSITPRILASTGESESGYWCTHLSKIRIYTAESNRYGRSRRLFLLNIHRDTNIEPIIFLKNLSPNFQNQHYIGDGL